MSAAGDDVPSLPQREARSPPQPKTRPLRETIPRLPAIIERAKARLSLNRWQLLLLGPAGLYLVLALGTILGTAGILLGLALTAMIATAGPRITADTVLSLYQAEPVAPGQAQALRDAVNSLSDRAGLPVEPALAIIPSLSIGAFSAGHGPRVALLMTEGLLRRLGLRDLVAIAAHEIGHIRNGDLAVFALADALVRVAQVLFYAGVAMLVIDVALWIAGEHGFGILPILLLIAAPALNSALQLALPRDHDIAADRTAAFLLGSMEAVTTAAAGLELAAGSPLDDFRLPVPQRRVPLPSPLRCPPGIATRVAALASRPPPVLLPPLAIPDAPMISLLGFGPVEMRPRNRWPGLWF